MNTNYPTLKPPKQSQGEPCETRKERDPLKKNTWGDASKKWASLSWGPVSRGKPSQGARLSSLVNGRFQNTYSDKAARAQSAPREWEAFRTFWLLVGPKSLSICPKSISYTPVNADRAGPLVSFLFLPPNLPFPPSWTSSLNLGHTIKCAKHFSPGH